MNAPVEIDMPGERPDWFPDWRGETTVIVASGPSAANVDLAQAKSKAKFITINDSWRLAPWADALYAHDRAWWEVWNGVPSFEGIKISQRKAKPEWGLKPVTVDKHRDEILLDRWGEVGWGGNSGFHALNLAIQFGARRIVLVGYDMRIDLGINWHGEHQRCLPNPGTINVIRWRKVLDAQAPLLKRLGVEVLNASAVSALTAYPKVDFADAIATLSPTARNIDCEGEWRTDRCAQKTVKWHSDERSERAGTCFETVERANHG